MYKTDSNAQKMQKLNAKLEADNVPVFIRDYFYNIRNGNTGINNYVAIKDLLLYLIDKKIINKPSISEITPSDLSSVTPGTITLYLGEKEDSEEMAPTSLHTRKCIYSGFWRYLKKTPSVAITENIVEEVKYKGMEADENNRQEKCPSDKQVFSMFNNISISRNNFSRIRNKYLLIFMIGSGVRIGEIANMDLKDLYIDESLYAKKYGSPFIKVLGKGYNYEKEKRTVFLTASAVKALNEWLEFRKTIRTEENAVFITSTGKRLTEGTIKRIFVANSDMTPHQIRHYYATKIEEKCGYIFTAQNMGHKLQGTTGTHYINGLTDNVKEILKTL